MPSQRWVRPQAADVTDRWSVVWPSVLPAAAVARRDRVRWWRPGTPAALPALALADPGVAAADSLRTARAPRLGAGAAVLFGRAGPRLSQAPPLLGTASRLARCPRPARRPWLLPTGRPPAAAAARLARTARDPPWTALTSAAPSDRPDRRAGARAAALPSARAKSEQPAAAHAGHWLGCLGSRLPAGASRRLLDAGRTGNRRARLPDSVRSPRPERRGERTSRRGAARCSLGT